MPRHPHTQTDFPKLRRTFPQKKKNPENIMKIVKRLRRLPSSGINSKHKQFVASEE